MRGLAAWVVYALGVGLSRLANWLLLGSHVIQGPGPIGPWDETGGGTVNRPAFVNEIDGESHDPQWND